ncbi:DUF6332 family protein [Streptomyces ziwulingensis]|uniref:Uncharacterized protein n=1 Tax=Streptomyces ziwulingensis TaxID=1045501 RepID=A0ABP9BEV0_9ACTN
MSGEGGRRTQARRDAITVEIGYALCSAAFAAAVIFGAVAGPAYAFGLPAGARGVRAYGTASNRTELKRSWSPVSPGSTGAPNPVQLGRV